MTSNENGGGWGPVASPVFKTVWSGVSRTEGSTPFLLRQSSKANNLRFALSDLLLGGFCRRRWRC